MDRFGVVSGWRYEQIHVDTADVTTGRMHNAPTRLPLPNLKIKLKKLGKRRISLVYS
jgi:hypothetical protein